VAEPLDDADSSVSVTRQVDHLAQMLAWSEAPIFIEHRKANDPLLIRYAAENSFRKKR
jgi:hypothetical protein